MIIYSSTLDTEAKVKAIYGGTTWVKIEGKFLLGASSSYAANSTGGSTTHTITIGELPSHNHSVGAHSHGLNSHTHSFSHTHGTDSKGGHAHDSAHYFAGGSSWSGTLPNNVYGSSYSIMQWPGSTKAQGVTSGFTTNNGAHTHSTNSQSTTTTGGASGSTANSTAFNSGNTGSGTAMSIMNPYKAVYIWERTA